MKRVRAQTLQKLMVLQSFFFLNQLPGIAAYWLRGIASFLGGENVCLERPAWSTEMPSTVGPRLYDLA